jgi:nucleoside-diphosphate-sugar epimerase
LKVFLAGATGVLGRRLVRLLVERGHEPVALARSPEKAKWLAAHRATPREASLFNVEQLVRAARGCDVVVHAATAIPLKARTSPRDWAANDRIRREGAQALAATAAKIHAKSYIQQSIVWVARPASGESFDEDSSATFHPLMQSAFDGEQIANQAGRAHGFSVAVLRCGMFYSADSGHTRMFRDGLLDRKMPIIGRGDALWSCLHADDAASAFLAAIERPRGGLWHVVDDQPVRVDEFLGALARLLEAQPPRNVPAWLARLLVGKQAVEFFSISTDTTSAKFRRDFDWRPRFGTIREGLLQVTDEWKRERQASG